MKREPNRVHKKASATRRRKQRLSLCSAHTPVEQPDSNRALVDPLRVAWSDVCELGQDIEITVAMLDLLVAEFSRTREAVPHPNDRAQRAIAGLAQLVNFMVDNGLLEHYRSARNNLESVMRGRITVCRGTALYRVALRGPESFTLAQGSASE